MKPAFCLPILPLLSACRPEAETADTAALTVRKPSYYKSESVKLQQPQLKHKFLRYLQSKAKLILT